MIEFRYIVNGLAIFFSLYSFLFGGENRQFFLAHNLNLDKMEK